MGCATPKATCSITLVERTAHTLPSLHPLSVYSTAVDCISDRPFVLLLSGPHVHHEENITGYITALLM